jgi:hypothetical protein
MDGLYLLRSETRTITTEVKEFALKEFVGVGVRAREGLPVGFSNVIVCRIIRLGEPTGLLRMDLFSVSVDAETRAPWIIVVGGDRNLNPLSEGNRILDLDVEFALLLVPDLVEEIRCGGLMGLCGGRSGLGRRHDTTEEFRRRAVPAIYVR